MVLRQSAAAENSPNTSAPTNKVSGDTFLPWPRGFRPRGTVWTRLFRPDLLVFIVAFPIAARPFPIAAGPFPIAAGPFPIAAGPLPIAWGAPHETSEALAMLEEALGLVIMTRRRRLARAARHGK